MSEIFKLPGSSYDEIIKIIKAYADGKIGTSVTLIDISHLTSIGTTTVSSNNGFLIELNLITTGNKKGPTELCIKLSSSLDHGIIDEIVSTLQTIVYGTEFLTKMLSAIKIRNGMNKDNLISHIMYSAGAKNTEKNRTGASAIIEILLKANLVEENDGVINLIKKDVNDNLTYPIQNDNKNNDTIPAIPIKNNILTVTKNGLTINVNINVDGENLDNLSDKIINFIRLINQEN